MADHSHVIADLRRVLLTISVQGYHSAHHDAYSEAAFMQAIRRQVAFIHDWTRGAPDPFVTEDQQPTTVSEFSAAVQSLTRGEP